MWPWHTWQPKSACFLGEGMGVYLLAEYSIRSSGHSDESPEYQHGCAYSTSQ